MKTVYFVLIASGLSLNACKNEQQSSSSKFWDLPEIIEEAKSKGILDDIYPVEGDCKEALENTDDSDRCVTKQDAVESLIKSCNSQITQSNSYIEEPDNFEESTREDTENRYKSCYQANLGYSRVIKGEAQAELELNDSEQQRDVSSSLKGDINLFEKPVDIFIADFSADALNPSTRATISVFGKEVFSFDKEVPEMNFAYTGDSPKKYEISYGLPLANFIVNPELKTGLELTGDLFLALKPYSKSNEEINFKSRLAGASYVRPHATASFEIFGMNIFNAIVGGYMQPLSDDLINFIDLNRKKASSLLSKEHQSSFLEGSLYVEANLLKTKYYHFFFDKELAESDLKSSCEKVEIQAFCPCTTTVKDLNDQEDKDNVFLRNTDDEILNKTPGLVCDPMSSKWMAVSKPIWLKQWTDYIWESKK